MNTYRNHPLALFKAPAIPPVYPESFRASESPGVLGCNLRSTSRINKSLPSWQTLPSASSPVKASSPAQSHKCSLMGLCFAHATKFKPEANKRKCAGTAWHRARPRVGSCVLPPMLPDLRSANFCVLNGGKNGWEVGEGCHCLEACFSAHGLSCHMRARAM